MTALPDALPPWPALADAPAPLPAALGYRRGIWGKVQGAASDYRWIARSAGFGAGYRDSELAAALRLGAEDTPVTASLWRCLPGRHLAVAVYPSRARDSAGRLTVLEKQVAEWTAADATLPAALAALWLLPAVAGHDDRDWWAASMDPRWREPDFALPLAPGSADGPPDAAEGLCATISAGCAALTALTEPAALQRCFATLLAGRVPALLPTSAALPPAALAALLLGLPRAWADRLSLAGNLAARNLDPWDLRRNWDLIAGPGLPAMAPAPDGGAQIDALAAAIVAALSAGDPAGLAGCYGGPGARSWGP